MANDLNQCTFTGRLGKDPETRHTAQGDEICSFTIAVGSQWSNKATGEREEATEWVNVTAFGKLAEVCGKYLEKGSRVLIQGAMKTRKWEKDVITQYSTGIVLDNFNGKMQMLDAPKSNGGAKPDRPPSPRKPHDSGYGVEPAFDDDIPF